MPSPTTRNGHDRRRQNVSKPSPAAFNNRVLNTHFLYAVLVDEIHENDRVGRHNADQHEHADQPATATQSRRWPRTDGDGPVQVTRINRNRSATGRAGRPAAAEHDLPALDMWSGRSASLLAAAEAERCDCRSGGEGGQAGSRGDRIAITKVT
jgi:hypothetical protein